MISTLMISTELPAEPMTGGRIRTYQLARALAHLGPVTILGFTQAGERVLALEHPLRCVGVPWVEPPLYAQMRSDDVSASAQAYHHLAEEVPEPWIVSCYESAIFGEQVDRLCADVDLVVIEHSLMGGYLGRIPSEVPTVLDLHNVHSRQAYRGVERGREQPHEARRLLEYERSLIERADLTLTVSEQESRAVRNVVPGAWVEVVPNGVDAGFFLPGDVSHSPGYMLFTGLMNYGPNVEGVVWFAREVLPFLEQATLHVVGSTPGPEVEALACDRVVVHGEVADTRPYQWQANLVIVPLLSGGGTRLKILEAAACGNAIVSTTIGAEGLDLVPGQDLLIADSPPDFAEAVRRVLADDHLRARLGESARNRAERSDWAAIGERLREIIVPLAAAGCSARPTAADPPAPGP